MASQGTLLSDLDTKTPVISNDDDLVNQSRQTLKLPALPSLNPSSSGELEIPQVFDILSPEASQLGSPMVSS